MVIKSISVVGVFLGTRKQFEILYYRIAIKENKKMRRRIKIIVQSSIKNDIDKGKNKHSVYFDFIDAKSYWLFLKLLYNNDTVPNENVFGIIEYENILQMNENQIDQFLYRGDLKWYSGFEIVYSVTPQYFRFSNRPYKLNATIFIEEIALALKNNRINIYTEEDSLVTWFTIDIGQTNLTDIIIK